MQIQIYNYPPFVDVDRRVVIYDADDLAPEMPSIIYGVNNLGQDTMCIPSMLRGDGPQVARERIQRDGVGFWDIRGMQSMIAEGGLDFTINVPAELYEHSYRVSRPRGPKGTQMVSVLENSVNADGEVTTVSMVVGTLTQGQFKPVGLARDVANNQRVQLIHSWFDALALDHLPPGTVARRA